ncbi:MAG: HD domain-containing phosphohydrolase [Planctomycetota bacterium]
MSIDAETVERLVREIEQKDLSTAAHTWRVVLYLRAIAESRGAGAADLDRATRAAALHDIGKLDVPDRILQKPGRLTEEEFGEIKRHPGAGYKRLLDLGETDEWVLEVAHDHHERIDGGGYPRGLRDAAIPQIARDFAVIDTFDALTSIRPYRREIGDKAAAAAIKLIEAEAGSHFCPDSAERFVKLYRAGTLEFIMEHHNDEATLARDALRARSSP